MTTGTGWRTVLQTGECSLVFKPIHQYGSA